MGSCLSVHGPTWLLLIRVVEVLGVPGICAHIEDHVTGEVMVLEEGAELAFTLPAHQAEEGRFTLHSVPFGSVEGRSPDCPNSEAGTIVMELGECCGRCYGDQLRDDGSGGGAVPRDGHG